MATMESRCLLSSAWEVSLPTELAKSVLLLKCSGVFSPVVVILESFKELPMEILPFDLAILFLFSWFFSMTADSWYSLTNDTNVGFRDVLSSLNPPEKPNVECHFLLFTVSFKKSLGSPATFKMYFIAVSFTLSIKSAHFSFPPVTLILVRNCRHHGLLCPSINHGPYKMNFLFLLNLRWQCFHQLEQNHHQTAPLDQALHNCWVNHWQ